MVSARCSWHNYIWIEYTGLHVPFTNLTYSLVHIQASTNQPFNHLVKPFKMKTNAPNTTNLRNYVCSVLGFLDSNLQKPDLAPRALSLRGCFEWSPLLYNEKFLSWWEWSFPGLECHNPSGTSGRSWCESCVTGILKVNRESLRNACIFFVLHHWKQRLNPTLLTPYHSYAVTHSSKVKCALFYNVFFFLSISMQN